MTIHPSGGRVVGVVLALLLAVPAAPVLAVDADEAAAMTEFWETSFADLRIRGAVTSFVDGPDLDAQGQPIVLPDVLAVNDFGYVVARKRRQQVNRMRRLQNQRRAQSIIGAQATQEPGGDALYLGWRTAEPMPANLPGGLLFNVIFYGPGGVPMAPGLAADAFTGSVALDTGGQYEGQDQLLVGGTDTRGLAAGQRPEYNDADARLNGVYRNGRWLVETPIPAGATSFGAFLQGQADGQVALEWMTNHAGLRQFPLGATAVSDDLCIAGAAFPILDASGTVDRFLVRVVVHDPLIDPALGPLPFGVTGADGFSTTPAFILQPELAIATTEFMAPPVHITFGGAATDGASAPSAEGLVSFVDGWTIDLSGERSGPFIGDQSCGSLTIPATPDVVLRDDIVRQIAASLGMDEAEVTALDGADGSDVRVVFDPAAPGEGPLMAVVVGNQALTQDHFDGRVGTSFCEVTNVEIRSPGVLEVCPDETHRLFLFDPFPGQTGEATYGRTMTLEFPGSGWPNGRRIGDDATTMALDALLGGPDPALAGAVDDLRETYAEAFPDLAAPFDPTVSIPTDG